MPPKKKKCWYAGHEIISMEFANFTRQEIRDYERQRGEKTQPEQCPGCGAMRTPQWVKRSLGGRGSGLWQWSLVFPHHSPVQRKVLSGGNVERE